MHQKAGKSPRSPSDFASSRYLDWQSFSRRSELDRRAGMFSRRKPFAGHSVEATAPIKEFAGRFKRTETGIQNMILRIKERLNLVREKPSVVSAHYMRQTAHDAFVTRKIPAIFHKNNPVLGCNTMCMVVASCLRAKRIPCRFVRTVDFWTTEADGQAHSVVLFKLGRKTFVSDPFLKGRAMIQVGEELSGQIKKLKGLGLWIEGRSPEEIGMLAPEMFPFSSKPR